MNILFFGDIVGKIGIKAIASCIDKLKKEYSVDFVVANGENTSKGKGLTERDFNTLLDIGIDVVTLGNHYNSKSQIVDYIDDVDNIVRPINLKNFDKGVGSAVFRCNDTDIRITNVLGKVMMDVEVDPIIDSLNNIFDDDKCKIHIIDFHGEATSEKKMYASYYDGSITALVGTHTHVQTNDAQVLKNGTGYISDIGMCGSYNSIIGFNTQSAINRFIYESEIPIYVDEVEDMIVNAVIIKANEISGMCEDIININLKIGNQI